MKKERQDTILLSLRKGNRKAAKSEADSLNWMRGMEIPDF
ncbi:protein of unknown function [Candidatus Methylacidiphilum fumarolicum]|uniref:Uncharacterized protein n=1 Tax=Candidatus Methylacidiphilum fumarolicum TaxID=591154 RepID=A0ABM9IC88_9BACT|nr:protein of unknown function [Candidatus Methylacidiphilum fumarolicum]